MERILRICGRAGFAAILAAGVYYSLFDELPRAFGDEVVLHVGGYGAMMLTVGLGWPERLWQGLALVLGIGAAIEVAQIRDLWRGFEWSDILYNAIGAGGVALLLYGLRRMRGPGARQTERHGRD